ncbi:hypothetical protein KKB55_23330, partial [Myxococcota bacterium]|nr:hypothetical protein [Myxococcota bacterium]
KTVFGLAPVPKGVAEPAPDMNKTVFGLAPVPKGVVEPAPDTNKTVFGLAPVPKGVVEHKGDAPRTLFGVASPLAAASMATPQRAPVAALAEPPSNAAQRPAGNASAKRLQGAQRREKDREAGELVAAAAIAAAIAEEERQISRALTRRWLLVIATLTLAAALSGVFFYQQRFAFQARTVGPLSVLRDGARWRVSTTIYTSEPATVRYPGGEAKGQGERPLSFELEAQPMKLGENHIALEVIPEAGGEAKALSLMVMLHYRLSTPPLSPPQPGVDVPAQIEVLPGWEVSVEGGRAARVDAQRFNLGVDPSPLLAQVDSAEADVGRLPVRLTLRPPDGAPPLMFEERVTLPLPKTPLRLLAPPRGWAGLAPELLVRGVTAPRAQVTLGEITITADEAGAFALQTPIEVGAQALTLRADGAQMKPTSLTFSAHRETKASLRARLQALRRQARGLKPTPAPSYAALQAAAADPPAQLFKLKGRLISARRGAEVDEVQIATCAEEGGCPVWAEISGPLLVEEGASLTLIGRLVGLHAYEARNGQRLTVPKLQEALLLP